jgi:hypothetical protein
MREIRPSGSEGGGIELNRSFLPLSGIDQNNSTRCGPMTETTPFSTSGGTDRGFNTGNPPSAD